MKKLLLLVTVLALALAVLPSGKQMTQAQDDQPWRVAAVAPSATNDLAFSQSMYDALLRVQEELGEDAFQFDFQDGTFVVDDAAVALREWAASGEYDLIIAHGSQYGAIVEELAPEFPDVSFAWGTDVNTFGLDNVFAYEAASQEGGYINGVIAAAGTESNVIGVIGPIEVGDAKLYVDGFKAGVAATNPDVEVLVNYIGSFSDVPLATEAAQAMIEAGADVLTGTAQMTVGPIGVAQQQEQVAWFGTQSNQAPVATDVVVMSQVYHWEVVLMDILANIEAGVLGGETYTINLENGGLAIEINQEAKFFAGDDGAATLEFLNTMISTTALGIIDGEIAPLPEEGAAPGETPEPEATTEPGS